MARAILGVHLGHDAAAALLRDGVLVYAEEEERVARRKNFFGLPAGALANALAGGGTAPDEVEAVGIAWDLVELGASRRELAELALSAGNGDYASRKLDRFGAIAQAAGELRRRFPRARFFEWPHHLAHAASVVPFDSGMRQSGVAALVLDAVGERDSATAYGDYTRAESRLLRWPLRASVGYFYQRWAEVLGFRGRQACGYLMSLAAHGDPSVHRERLRDACVGVSPEGLPWVDPARFDPARGDADSAFRCFPERLLRELGLGEPSRDVMAHAHVAAAVQALTEEIVVPLCAWQRRETGAASLAVSGGVFLNCVLVSAIKRHAGYRRVLTGPAAKDCGGSVGAAVLAYRALYGAGAAVEPAGPCLGTAITGDEEVWETAARFGAVERSGDLAAAACRDVVEGRLVAVAEGRLEFGPRALGARSILAAPADPGVVERLNRLKGRFAFQPVAASLEAAAARELFGVREPEPFMTATYPAAPAAAAACPAVVHADGGCRVHVADGSAPLLTALLDRLRAAGAAAVVVNTSLNRGGEPLPRTAADALGVYCGSDLDVLYHPGARVHLSPRAKRRVRALLPVSP